MAGYQRQTSTWNYLLHKYIIVKKKNNINFTVVTYGRTSMIAMWVYFSDLLPLTLRFILLLISQHHHHVRMFPPLDLPYQAVVEHGLDPISG